MSKAQCTNCGDILESRSNHEFVTCNCYMTSQELCWKISDAVIMATRTYAEPLDDNQQHQLRCALFSTIGTGFFLDGGNDCPRLGGNLDHIKPIEGIELLP